MKPPFAWAAVAVAALAAGGSLWWIGRPEPPVSPPSISGAALYAASFRDASGANVSLGHFQGRPLLINFWATWCGPCREEMPVLERAAREWSGRVAFVGLSDEAPETVARFARDVGVTYPLWVGGEQVGDLARRLGDRMAVLPFTALVDGSGALVGAKVGPYSAAELDAALAKISGEKAGTSSKTR